MKPLFESNLSKFLASNMHDKQFKNACIALLNKGYDIARISDSKIKRMSPQEAFKLKGKQGDKYFKFWFDSKKFAFCTWANTMIDLQFNWKKNERGTVIGNSPYTWNYFNSNDAISELTDCYVVAFDDMPKVEPLKSQRKEAKKDALALMTDEQIKKMNLERYQQLLVKNGISNGKEIEKVKKIFERFLKIASPETIQQVIVRYSWIFSDIRDILNGTTKFMQAVSKYSGDLSKLSYEISDYTKTIDKEYAALDTDINSSQKYHNPDNVKSFLKNFGTKGANEFGSILHKEDPKYYDIYEKFLAEFLPMYKKLGEVLTKISNAKNFSLGDLYAINETLYMISQAYEKISPTFISICSAVNTFVDTGDSKAAIDYLNLNPRLANEINKILTYIKMLSTLV